MMQPTPPRIQSLSPTSGNKPTSYFPISIALSLIIIYLVLHSLIPAKAGAFFWSSAPTQWIDWIFWSLLGIMLNWASELASLERKEDTPRTWKELWRRSRGVLVALFLLGVIYYREYNLLNWEFDLARTPLAGIALAFGFGFYAKTSTALFFEVINFYIRRIIDMFLGRRLGKPIDDEEYIQLYVDKRLHVAYRLAKSSSYGIPGHIASRNQRVRYRIANFVGHAGFTVNAIKTVFFGSSVLKVSKESLAELVAHEASHVYQNYISDSVEQEIKAYVTGARVRESLNARHSVKSKRWLALGDILCDQHGEFVERSEAWEEAHKEAVEIVRKDKKLAPLYGVIPESQKPYGKEDRREALKQASFLVSDFFKTTQKSIEKQDD